MTRPTINTTDPECRFCNGVGWVNPNGLFDFGGAMMRCMCSPATAKICPTCGGGGWSRQGKILVVCNSCNGKGTLPVDKG